MGHLAFRMEMKDVDVGKLVASSLLLCCACWKKTQLYVDKPPKPVKCLIPLLLPFLSQDSLWEMEGMLREMGGRKTRMGINHSDYSSHILYYISVMSAPPREVRSTFAVILINILIVSLSWSFKSLKF